MLDTVDSRGQRIANAISREARYRFSHDRVAEAARDVGAQRCPEGRAGAVKILHPFKND